jgi:predicted DNA-binding protein with PD1-like motif
MLGIRKVSKTFRVQARTDKGEYVAYDVRVDHDKDYTEALRQVRNEPGIVSAMVVIK